MAAAVLALLWSGAGIAGLVAAYLYDRWLIAAAAVFALGYGLLWIRVAARGRLLDISRDFRPGRPR